MEMMRLYIRYGAQDASMISFIARVIIIITQNLPIPTDTVWIREFQRDTLKRTRRSNISCPRNILTPELEVTKEEQEEI